MDERTHTSYKEDVHSLIVATTSPFYTENKPALKDLFEKSLLVKRGQYSLYDIQFEILGHIIATDSARQKYLRQRGRFARAIRSLKESGASVERIKLAQERFQTMSDYVAATRLFLGQLRSIGDGLAWWFLNYDRATLRLLAEHAYIQAPERGIGLYSEIEKCANLAAQGQPFLLNSITNFLRFGDITTYDKSKDKFKLIEVKAGKLQTLSTMRQAKQLALVQEAIETGSHSEFAGVTITKIMAEEPLLTYLRIFERVMAEAKQNLASSRVFGNYLSFGVFYLNEIGKLSEKEADKISESIDKRCDSIKSSKTDVIIPFMSNVTTIVHFSRMLAPYTIFPISSDLRFALMTGDFIFLSKINVSGLERWLRKRGWETKYIPPPDNLVEGQEPTHLPILHVFRANNPLGVTIGLDIIALAAAELWMAESIERTIAAIFAQATPDSAYSVNFPNIGKYAWD